MSEGSTDNGGTSQDDGRSRHERDKDEFEAGTGYQPSTNQAQDEPLPASHHDDSRQEAADDGRQEEEAAARRSGEPARANPPASGDSGRGKRGRGDKGRDQADHGK